MIRTVSTIGTAIVVFLLAGCADDRQQNEQPDAKQAQVKREDKDQALTADAAKRALLAMDPGQIRPGVLVPPPEDEPIKVINPDEIDLGIYRCNLKKRTFHASAHYPEAPRHKFNRVSGVFEPNAQGKWVAKVTESESGG